MSYLRNVFLIASVITSVAAPAGADGLNVIAAATDLSPELSRLRIERSGQPIQFIDPILRLQFEDHRGNGEILEILLDPTYVPSSSAHFLVRLDLPLPDGAVLDDPSAGECDWDAGKTIATCSVVDDGGQFQIVVQRRGASLDDSDFLFRIAPDGGYSGFRLGVDDGGHDIHIEVVDSNPVETLIDF